MNSEKNSKQLMRTYFILLNILVLVSASVNDFNAKPEKCKVPVKELDSTIEQLGECTDKKWQPLVPKKLLGKLIPTGIPKLHLLPNGTSVKGVISGAINLFPNASSLLPHNLSDPIPEFLKKLIPKSLLNKPKIFARNRGQQSYSELKLNERVCCLLYENICVRNKVYRMNCKISRDFGDEIQDMYDKLFESCAENGLYIDESFCGEQKTESYGSNNTCDQYLPCSQTQVFAVYADRVDNSCQSLHSQYLPLFWISIIFIELI